VFFINKSNLIEIKTI